MRFKLYLFLSYILQMIQRLDSASKMFALEDNLYTITTYVDISKLYTKDEFEEKIKHIINTHPVLKNKVIETNNDIHMESVNELNIKDLYTINKDSYPNFDKHSDTIINTDFTSDIRWFFYYLEDTEQNKSRIYFKINHVYTDGSKLIDILNTLVSNPSMKDARRKLTNIYDKLYYLIIGTLIIMFDTIKIFIKIITTFPKLYTHKKIEYIKATLSLSDIKKYTNAKNITINDFMYSLMIRTDYLYNGKERDITTMCPIKIDNENGGFNNNVALIVIRTNNALENNTLLESIHRKFNSLKYSLYVPFFSFLIKNIACFFPVFYLKYLTNTILNVADYSYTNMIGPNAEYLDDIHFLLKPNNKEVIFNIISSIDKINILCSYKEGIIDNNKKFEECIYKAYDSLMNNT